MSGRGYWAPSQGSRLPAVALGFLSIKWVCVCARAHMCAHVPGVQPGSHGPSSWSGCPSGPGPLVHTGTRPSAAPDGRPPTATQPAQLGSAGSFLSAIAGLLGRGRGGALLLPHPVTAQPSRGGSLLGGARWRPGVFPLGGPAPCPQGGGDPGWQGAQTGRCPCAAPAAICSVGSGEGPRGGLGGHAPTARACPWSGDASGICGSALSLASSL